MRILIATDAFRPQVNGVVRSLESLAAHAPAFGARVDFLSPHGFPSVPLPTYREIRLALVAPGAVGRHVRALEADGGPIDHIHIATEGPIGYAARRYCLRRKLPFTTSYHTRFPEYIAARWPIIPERVSYAVLRRFHNAGDGIMVSTPSVARELDAHGFRPLMRWSRGVDGTQFSPTKRAPWDLPRPIFLYAGRVAPEKNLEAFLSLDLPGSKVLAGDGPSAEALQRAYPEAHFLGMQRGDDLARSYASADVFVFPSRTDTFGMVLLEALASGVPVAAFPVPGPLDVIGTSGAGVLDEDLRAACLGALDIPRESARAHAETFTWAHATQQFLGNIATARQQYAARQAARASGKEGQLLRQGQVIKP